MVPCGKHLAIFRVFWLRYCCNYMGFKISTQEIVFCRSINSREGSSCKWYQLSGTTWYQLSGTKSYFGCVTSRIIRVLRYRPKKSCFVVQSTRGRALPVGHGTRQWYHWYQTVVPWCHNDIGTTYTMQRV